MATYYWVGGDGTWDNVSTANWSASSGGAAGAGPPTASDSATFDASSGSGTCTVASTAVANNIVFSAATLTLLLADNFSTPSGLVFTAGAIDLNSNTFTCTAVNTDSSNARTIHFGTGKIVVTANNVLVWNAITATNLSYTGTPRIECSYAGSTGTRSIRHASTAGGAESTALSFYVTGGTDTVAFRGRALDLILTGFSGTFDATVQATTVYGNLTLGSVSAFNVTTVIFATTSGEKFITSNGVTINGNVLFNGVGGAWSLQDNLTLSAAKTFTLTNGTLDAKTHNVSINTFALGAGTKTLALGSGTWTVADASWNANSNNTGFTVSPSTGTISMTSASAKTFAGGSETWPTLNQGGAGALTIQQSNTFTNITNTVQPATVTLTSGTTQTVTDFDLSGTSGNLITLNSSTAGSQATLTDSGGVNSVSYLDIKDIAATGYGEWQAYASNGNVDSGNNTGWVFTAPSPLIASEYQISLKSFTERRRF